MLARALKRSAGFHVTNRPAQRDEASCTRSRGARPSSAAAERRPATVLRDAFAQAWQSTVARLPGLLAGLPGRGWRERAGACRGRAGHPQVRDATPDLMYCAEGLVDAFAGRADRADHPRWPGRGRGDARGRRRAGLVQARGSQRGQASSPTRSSASRPKPTWPRGRPLAGREVRDALARLGAHDGQAAQQHARRTADHAALRAGDTGSPRGGQGQCPAFIEADLAAIGGPCSRARRPDGHPVGRVAAHADGPAGHGGRAGGRHRPAPGRLRVGGLIS